MPAWSSSAGFTRPGRDLGNCPRHGRADGPLCRIEMFDPWVPALTGIAEGAMLEVFYWLHRSRRDLLLQCPRNDGVARGTFSLRSPIRPNPIGTSMVRLERRDGANLFVRGLDCLDGTPTRRSEARPIGVRSAGATEARGLSGGRDVIMIGAAWRTILLIVSGSVGAEPGRRSSIRGPQRRRFRRPPGRGAGHDHAACSPRGRRRGCFSMSSRRKR